jgi:hypothetical protein
MGLGTEASHPKASSTITVKSRAACETGGAIKISDSPFLSVRNIAGLMLISSPHHKHTCRKCAEICTECAKDCERLGGMEDCIAACRACAQSCTAMAA